MFIFTKLTGKSGWLKICNSNWQHCDHGNNNVKIILKARKEVGVKRDGNETKQVNM